MKPGSGDGDALRRSPGGDFDLVEVEIVRSGGFGGTVRRIGPIPVESLSAQQRADVERLTERATPSADRPAPEVALRPGGPDRFSYEIALRYARGSRRFTIVEGVSDDSDVGIARELVAAFGRRTQPPA